MATSEYSDTFNPPAEPRQYCEYCECRINIEDEDNVYPIDYNARSAAHEATAWACKRCADDEGITDPRDGPQRP